MLICSTIGIVIACSAAAQSFAPLMVVRFLLGMFESCVQPCFIIMTSMWWRREEQSVLTRYVLRQPTVAPSPDVL
jgi:MFS family permease